MSDTLTDILLTKKEHVAACKKQVSEAQLMERLQQASPVRGFRAALTRKAEAKQSALIAEIKKASPSKGVIRADFDSPRLAEAYASGGASCLSVLTDAPYFQGDDSYLKAARDACALPALRKDFMIDPYQIIEARALEADCILLIMAALSDGQYRELYAVAEEMGLDVLVEAHDEWEIERACTQGEPRMIGINNRDLRSFVTDISVSERLSRYIPAGVMRISESGIAAHADLRRLQEYGIYAFLVGESLMRKADVATATRALLEG